METPLRRFASSPEGDATRGLAKPVPRWHWPELRPCHRQLVVRSAMDD